VARPARQRPTDGELEILAVLWAMGPSTVRQVHQTLLQSRQIHYNSVLKTLQIMVDKGLVSRDSNQSPQAYAAVASRTTTERHLLKDLMDRVFGGSMMDLVMRALSTKKSTPQEIKEIRERLRKLEDGK
jgi:BlaI family transcriptional regulator, penicillinase repressor